MTNSENKKVLLLSLSGIGNFLMQSPAIEAVKKAHPSWHITLWVAPRGTRTLAQNNPSINEVFEAPIKNSFLGHVRVLWHLRQQKFDAGIELSPGQRLKGALYLLLAGIPKRIGHEYPFFQRETGLFFTNSIPEDPLLHDIEQNTQLLKLLNINYSLRSTHYSLNIPLKYQKRADDLMFKLHIPNSKRLLGLHAGAASNFLWKRWPLQNFAELAQHFIHKNYHVLIFGGPDEGKLKRKLKGRLGANATLIESDLLTTAAVMQKCQLLISNDSGLMHLAAASGVVTFGLFGPTNEKQTGPRGVGSHVIRAPGTAPIYHTEKNFDLGNKPHETMRALTVDQVLGSIEA